jgi:hypothetical protein
VSPAAAAPAAESTPAPMTSDATSPLIAIAIPPYWHARTLRSLAGASQVPHLPRLPIVFRRLKLPETAKGAG